MNKIKINYSNITPLPSSFLVEQAILNILLTSPNLIKSILPILKLNLFYFVPHQLIYQSILELIEKNNSLTITILVTYLHDQNRLKEIGGIQTLLKIISRFENFSNLESYIKILNEKYIRRLIIEFGKEIIGLSYLNKITIDEIIEKIEKSFFYLTRQTNTNSLYSSAEILDEIFQEIKTNMNHEDSNGLKSSYKDLDAILQGFQKSDLIIIAGRPSMGKTAFALNVGKKIVEKYDIPLIIFSLEMSRQQIIYRFIASDSQINTNRLKTNKLSSEEWKKLSLSMLKLSKFPIFIDDNPNLTLSDIRSKLRRIFVEKRKNGLVIIDYLQLMKLSSTMENRVQEISYLTRNLKILAKEFEIPVFLLSQLSRNVESRLNKRPMLSDLRESGSIEQDADIVIMLYREDYYTEKLNSNNLTEFIIAKHRNGPVGTSRLLFNPEFASFENIEE
jgi:replicative DNA helicase